MIEDNSAYGVTHTGKNDNQQQPHLYEKIGPSTAPIYEVVADYSRKLN